MVTEKIIFLANYRNPAEDTRALPVGTPDGTKIRLENGLMAL